jgi:uncharacterized membrane protein YozB (DUF420 family)
MAVVTRQDDASGCASPHLAWAADCRIVCDAFGDAARQLMMASVIFPISRGSIMLDVVALAMVVVTPLLAWSIYQVKRRKNYALHGRVQLALGIVLLTVVVLFEIDIRLHGWRDEAAHSRFYDSLVFPVLYVHLFFAVTTTILWTWTIIGALRGFPKPPAPSDYSGRHKRIARLAAIDMFCTAVTGWTFYILAFIC